MTYLNGFFIFPDASKLLFPAEKRGPPHHATELVAPEGDATTAQRRSGTQS